MANQAPITVFDGAATPVSHTFSVQDNKTLPDGTRLSVWRENNTALPKNAQNRIELRQRDLKSGVTETRLNVVVPVMETTGGVNAQGYTSPPKVAYENFATLAMFSHPRSTADGRKLAVQIMRNLLNNISTSVTPVAAGVVHDAVVDGFMPT